MKTELDQQLDLYLNYLKNIKFASIKTVAAYSHDLSKFVEFLKNKHIYKVGYITEIHIEEFLSGIARGVSPANFSRKLYAIKGFCTFLERNNLLTLKITIKAPRNHKRNISYLTEEEVIRLLEAVKNSHLPYFAPRDTAIVSLLLNTGIRVSELTTLKVSDIEFRNEGFSHIKLLRKGGDESQLPVEISVVKQIKKYLAGRIFDENEALFLSRKGKPIRPNTVYWLVRHYLEKAGIKKQKMGPHILRHTAGTRLRAKGFDLVVIQKLLGHKKLETTGIYMHVEPKDLENAVTALAY